MPYWITETLSTTPVFAWVYLGVGVPWALALLPRADWRKPFFVLGAAFALGPAVLTLHMLILGGLGAQLETPLLRFDLVLGGTVAAALVGGAFAYLRSRHPAPAAQADSALAWDEKLLIALMIGGHVVRWFVAAYWPFIAYDTLWVYGYQGRLYTLLGYIPNSIDYYPQFLSLQYTFGQLAYGGINDHAARAVVPFINLGATFAVYMLGARLFHRRAGIYGAALWTFYHHVANWSRMGDLEIVTTLGFTLAAVWFISAWRRVPNEGETRGFRSSDHEALLAGAFLGIALWTKPTAGAFVWGVMLVFGVMAGLLVWRARRLDLRAILPYFRVALLTGVACAPLGGVWYVRNVLLGHEAVRFPLAFWLERAARSGAEWGWLWLALLLATAYLLIYRRAWLLPMRRLGVWLLANGLVALALLPSILTPRRMAGLEWVALGAAALCIAWVVWSWWRAASAAPSANAPSRGQLSTLIWAALLGLPYFITWFYSYSYDARLSFVIVPLMLLPSAYILARWASEIVHGRLRWLRPVYALLIVLLAMPGMWQPLYDGATEWDGLWSGELTSDLEKQRSGNHALIRVVDGLQIYLDTHDEPMRVVAPGLQTLPFFFPLEDIRIEPVPWRLSELDGVTYFIDSVVELRERLAGRDTLDNQVLGALRREDIMRRAWWYDDGTFSYDVYELHLENRFIRPEANGSETQDVVFGGFARYLGESMGGLEFWDGRPLYLTMIWEPIAPTDRDYMIFVHLRDGDGNLVQGWDAPVALNDSTTPPRYYSTRVWEVGEFIQDVRILRMGAEANELLGEGYSLYVGFYDLATGERVPVTVDGEVVGDSWLVDDRLSVVSIPPG
jgi:hypothetical protein